MKTNQKGFSAVIVLLSIITIAVVGFVGYYVYNTQQSKVEDHSSQEVAVDLAAAEQASTASSRESQQVNSNELIIEEWGVEFPVSGVVQNAIYTVVSEHTPNVEQIKLSIADLSSFKCKDTDEVIKDFTVGSLYRSTSLTDLALVTDYYSENTESGSTKIGSYYYFYWGGSGYGNLCNLNENTSNMIEDVRASFENINKTIVVSE